MIRPRATAFTLVELMVVLLLTVMIAGSAAAFMRVVSGARDIAENRLNGEQEATVALRQITSMLRNAYRPISADDVLFEGIAEKTDPPQGPRIRFRTIDRRIIRQGQPESDVHEIEYFVRDEGGRSLLMRRSDPTRNPPPDGGGVVEPIAGDVVGLDLQYFDGVQWTDHWPEKLKRWPTAVSVRLIYRADATGRRTGAVSSMVGFPYWDTTGAAAPETTTPENTEQ